MYCTRGRCPPLHLLTAVKRGIEHSMPTKRPSPPLHPTCMAQVERIKRSLHPGMLAEGRRQELQQLREQETARAADAAALTARAGGELLGLVQKHAQQLDGGW